MLSSDIFLPLFFLTYYLLPLLASLLLLAARSVQHMTGEASGVFMGGLVKEEREDCRKAIRNLDEYSQKRKLLAPVRG